jgi:hypothetical protein
MDQHEMCRPQISNVIEIQQVVFEMILTDRHRNWRFLHEEHKINGFQEPIPHPLVSLLMFPFNRAAQIFSVLLRDKIAKPNSKYCSHLTVKVN